MKVEVRFISNKRLWIMNCLRCGRETVGTSYPILICRSCRQTGHPVSDETRRRMSEARTRRTRPTHPTKFVTSVIDIIKEKQLLNDMEIAEIQNRSKGLTMDEFQTLLKDVKAEHHDS